jgi:hypothetical protein
MIASNVKAMLYRLKNRLNIKSDIHLVAIMLVFSIAEIAYVVAREEIFGLVGLTAEKSLLIKIPLCVIVIFPVYQALFLLTDTVLVQFRFAREFEKKMISPFRFKK